MEINYIKLGITLFLALSISGIAVSSFDNYLDKKNTEKIISSAIVGFKKSTDKLDRKIKTSRVNLNNEIKEFAQKRKIKIDKAMKKEMAEIQRISAIRKTNDETCSFWSKEYSKANSEYNKVMKKSACNRAMND